MPFNPTRRQLSEMLADIRARERHLEAREKRLREGERFIPRAFVRMDAKGRLVFTNDTYRQTSEDWWSNVMREAKDATKR